jgi:YD repeat-containing protein
MSDREKAGLRGPVRTCVEEIMHSGGAVSIAFEYSAEGRLLTSRTAHPDGSQWVTTHAYDAAGRLVKIALGKVGEPSSESLYAYDEGGRLTETRDADGKGIRSTYHYDQQSRKNETRSFAPEVFERYRGGVMTDSFWNAAQIGIGVPSGGTVTTLYDERDLPIERQILNNDGRLVSRFVRTYDGNGLIMEENQIQENPALQMVDKFPPEQREKFDDKRLEALNKAMKLMLSGKNGTGKRYTYDPEGRVIEVHDRNFSTETVTATSYNEYGDKSEERITTTNNSIFPAGVPYSMDENGTLIPTEAVPEAPSLPKLVLEPNTVEYRYKYDQHRNWTERTTVHRSESNQYSTVHRRVLTYY